MSRRLGKSFQSFSGTAYDRRHDEVQVIGRGRGVPVSALMCLETEAWLG